MRTLLLYLKGLIVRHKEIDNRLYDLPNRQYACTAILPNMEEMNKQKGSS